MSALIKRAFIELTVRISFKEEGVPLTTPERFWEVIEILKENITKGKYFVHWDGTDDNGKPWRNTWIKRECVMTKGLELEWRKMEKERQK